MLKERLNETEKLKTEGNKDIEKLKEFFEVDLEMEAANKNWIDLIQEILPENSKGVRKIFVNRKHKIWSKFWVSEFYVFQLDSLKILDWAHMNGLKTV